MVVADNKRTRNDHERNAGRDKRAEGLQPQQRKAEIKHSKEGRRHASRQSREQAVRDDDQHASIERQIVHPVVNEVVAHAVLQIAHFGDVELFEALVERNLG